MDREKLFATLDKEAKALDVPQSTSRSKHAKTALGFSFSVFIVRALSNLSGQEIDDPKLVSRAFAETKGWDTAM